MAERETEIFFPGSYSNPDTIREEWKQFGPVISDLLDDVMEYAYAHWGTPLYESYIKIMELKGIEGTSLNSVLLFQTLQLVDKYIRQLKRRDVVQSLKDFNMHVSGNGWELLGDISKNIKISPMMTYDETIDKMNNSKVVTTVLPLFFEGSHERIFDAAIAGAVPFTDSSAYLRENFFNGQDIIFYEGNKSNAAEVIGGLLSDEDKLSSIANASRHKVLNEHQWVHRAAKILETVILHKNFKSL